jgi:hypothetical protein
MPALRPEFASRAPEERKYVSKFTSFLRNHRPLTLVGGGIVVFGAGIGVGIGISHLVNSSASPAAAASATSTTSTPLESAKPHSGAHKGVHGQITAENGSTWTVLTKRGKTVTVDITPSTHFGSVANPATESAFPVGSEITATGTRSGGIVTAKRVFTPLGGAGGATPTTSAG